jgi:hypothetical protein
MLTGDASLVKFTTSCSTLSSYTLKCSACSPVTNRFKESETATRTRTLSTFTRMDEYMSESAVCVCAAPQIARTPMTARIVRVRCTIRCSLSCPVDARAVS